MASIFGLPQEFLIRTLYMHHPVSYTSKVVLVIKTNTLIHQAAQIAAAPVSPLIFISITGKTAVK
jgi:hypothetical protein